MKASAWIRLASRVAVLGCLGILGLSVGSPAKADTLLLAQTTLISGSASVTDSFTVASSGTVTVSLANLSWPERLSSLSFAATSPTQVLSAWSWSALAANVDTFKVDAGTYFAHITGQAAGLLNLGLYSLSISFQPNAVPLPASAWMLLAGIFVLVGIARLVNMFVPLGMAERVAEG